MWRKIFFSLLVLSCLPFASSWADVNTYEINDFNVTADVPEEWKVVNIDGGVQFLDKEQRIIVSVLARASNGNSLESIAQGFTEHLQFTDVKKQSKNKIVLTGAMQSVPIEIILDGNEERVLFIVTAGQKDKNTEKLIASTRFVK